MQVTQEIQELRENMKVEFDDWKNGLTHEVRSGCAGDPIRAPLLRSLLKKFGYTDAEELHDNFINGFMLIENFWREWGGHRDPMSLPPCPTTNLCS